MQSTSYKNKAETPNSIHQHKSEILRRLRWCVEQGPKYWPANMHVHKAPGDDTCFLNRVPPWFSDGQPNPSGIICMNNCTLPVGSVLLPDYEKNSHSKVQTNSRASKIKINLKQQKNKNSIDLKCHKIKFKPVNNSNLS